MSLFVGPLVSQTVYNVQTTATASASAPTGANATLISISPNPIAGTYYISCSFDVSSGVAGAAIQASVYIGGSQVTDSNRKIVPFSGGTLTSGSGRGVIHTQALVAVNGSQAVEVRWSTSNAGPTAVARNLIILKVA